MGFDKEVDVKKVRLDIGLASIREELNRATKKFGPFKSAMEGLAIIEEEVDEFKHEVRHGTLDKARQEAVQVAAMALRFLVDITD